MPDVAFEALDIDLEIPDMKELLEDVPDLDNLDMLDFDFDT
jgi:hypothetical protein